MTVDDGNRLGTDTLLPKSDELYAHGPSLRPYESYKSSGLPWLGDVPVHWNVRKLRNILAEATERGRPDWPLLSVVRERGVILRDVTAGDENHNYIPDDLTNYKVVHRGQFAMNKMKAWQGSYGVSVYDGIVSPAYYVFDVADVMGDYFHLAIRSKAYVPFFGLASDGVRIGQWDLSKARMQEIPFALPPLHEQQAIVRYLDHVDRRIRRYVDAKQKLIALLEEERQAVVNWAVTRGLDPNVRLKRSGVKWLGDVPEHWEIRRLRTVVEMRVSNVDKHTNDNEVPVRLCNYVDVYKNDRITPSMPFMTATATLAEVEQFRLEQGDVLITKDSETWDDIGVPSLVAASADDLLSGYHLALLRPHRNMLGAYLARTLENKAVGYQFHVRANGVTRYGLTHVGIQSVQIPLPPLPEQCAIVEHLDKATADIDAGIARARRQVELVEEYRTRLVADVVTGKLDVREAAAQLPGESDDGNQGGRRHDHA